MALATGFVGTISIGTKRRPQRTSILPQGTCQNSDTVRLKIPVGTTSGVRTDSKRRQKLLLLFHNHSNMETKNIPQPGDILEVEPPHDPFNILEVLRVIAFPVACLIVGAVIALRITGGYEVYSLTSSMKSINDQIAANNKACVAAVESNKKLAKEYEQKYDSLSLLMDKRVRTEKVLTASGDVIPASVPAE